MQVNQLMSKSIMPSELNEKTLSAGMGQVQKQNNFGAYLNDAIGKVNGLQLESDKLTSMFAEGKKVDLHEVMIAGQKASISLQATLEIRNKVVEAYQEIMRMQV